MFLLISGIILTNFIICYVQKFGKLFTKKDCYKSLSDPVQYIEILHYFPSGPLLIYTIFQIELLFLETDKEPIRIEKTYLFQRIDLPCVSTILFTTQGRSFKKMILNIKFYLFNIKNHICSFNYIFHNGFIPGRHLLLSKYTSFGANVNIDIKGQDIIQRINFYIEANLEDLLRKSYLNNCICLISESNRAAVIHPKYIRTKPYGFIIKIEVVYYTSDKPHTIYQIMGYDCNSNDININQDVVLLDEHPINDKLFFSSSHFISNIETKKVLYGSFIIPNMKRENINTLSKNLPKGINKIFLIKNPPEYEILNDGTNRSLSKYSDGMTYFAFDIKNTNVLFNIQRIEHRDVIL